MMDTLSKFSNRQHGMALVETLIATPLLLFLMLATAEITNAFVDHNSLTKSVRNAARYVASNAILGTTGTIIDLNDPSSGGAILKAHARNLVIYGNVAGTGEPLVSGLAAASVQVTDVGGNNVQVTASYPYSSILGATLPAFGLGSDMNLGITLQATVAMKAL